MPKGKDFGYELFRRKYKQSMWLDPKYNTDRAIATTSERYFMRSERRH
jgi:hypothetical protein